MKALPVPPVLIITDRKQAARPLLAVAQALLAGGCRWISLREPDLSRAERVDLLLRLVRCGAEAGATIGVHADYDAAMATGAGGVHLPRHGSITAARAYLGDQATIGISTHDQDEVQRAAELGADYVTLSPIFETASKPNYGPSLGLAGLAELARTAAIPIYALGGVDVLNAARCRGAGAAGVAIMGAAMRADDPETMIRSVIAALDRTLVAAPEGGHSSVKLEQSS
jgi:thiamine-phosphate pyrophosphorylase